MKPREKITLTLDRLERISGAKQDVIQTCKERNVNCQRTDSYLTICLEVLAKYHTTKDFKVGDKVYVNPREPGEPTVFDNYIRATITEIDSEWGYHLRAFEQDLPGIFMFNIWDKDLLPRTTKANKRLSWK